MDYSASIETLRQNKRMPSTNYFNFLTTLQQILNDCGITLGADRHRHTTKLITLDA